VTALAWLLALAVLAAGAAVARGAGGLGHSAPAPETRAAVADTDRGVAQAPDGIVIRTQPVYAGCNVLVVMAPIGTHWTSVVGHFSDPSSVLAIWRFDNTTKRYHGIYFGDPAAPTDGQAANDVESFSVFACVTHDGSVG
jgi:hypothetical protein